MTTSTQVVDCACGHPIRLPFTLGGDTPAVDGVVTIELRYVAFDEHMEWHLRRFHGPRGGPGLPLEAAS